MGWNFGFLKICCKISWKFPEISWKFLQQGWKFLEICWNFKEIFEFQRLYGHFHTSNKLEMGWNFGFLEIS